jgi:hypothetical protein
MRVFLIHGMGRSRVSMLVLASRLKRAGHQTSLFGYSVARHDLDTIRTRFVSHIGTVLEDDARRSASSQYAVIGHSLGNIITRHATNHLPTGLARFVMLAPPNQSPDLARKYQGNPFFRIMTGDAGKKLADPDFYECLGSPEVPTVILAGDKGERARWLPGTGDGVVGVDETKLGDVPHHVFDALHTFIMNHPEVTRQICHFLEDGKPIDEAA